MLQRKGIPSVLMQTCYGQRAIACYWGKLLLIKINTAFTDMQQPLLSYQCHGNFFSWTWSWIFFSWAFHVLGKISLGHVILLCPFLFIHKLYSLQGFFFPWGSSWKASSSQVPWWKPLFSTDGLWLKWWKMAAMCGLLYSNIDFLAFRLY